VGLTPEQIRELLRPKVRYQGGKRMEYRDYSKMLERLDGRCEICGEQPPRGLVVDHLHKTGGPRGFLCMKCNSGLGFFNDDPSLLVKAARYVRRVS
jgi:Recombination endonuclease VII